MVWYGMVWSDGRSWGWAGARLQAVKVAELERIKREDAEAAERLTEMEQRLARMEAMLTRLLQG